jgi:quercetin dioxygenase-like cupin family protein
VHYKIQFDKFQWEAPLAGVRQKQFVQGNQRRRLVEYSTEMPLHRCEKGHYGYVIEGQLEIEFDNAEITYEAGDGIFIPDGPEHRHRGKTISEKEIGFLC